MPKLVEAVAKYNETVDQEESKNAIKNAQGTAKFAIREIKSGFPVLYSQAIVNLWSLLEALIYSIIYERIIHTPNLLSTEPISKLKVRLGPYELMTKEERISYIIELLEKDLGAGIKNGVSRFEVMLEPFKLSGTVEDSIRHDIFELGQVRNVIIHKAGIADKQFIDACPWLKLKVGSKVSGSNEMFERYTKALGSYLVVLINRFRDLDKTEALKNSKT